MGVNRKKVPPHLYDRYGLKARPWPVIGLIAAVGLSLAGYLLTSIGGNIAAGGDVTLVSWEETGINEVTVTWAVRRADNQSVCCAFRTRIASMWDTPLREFNRLDLNLASRASSVLAVRFLRCQHLFANLSAHRRATSPERTSGRDCYLPLNRED